MLDNLLGWPNCIFFLLMYGKLGSPVFFYSRLYQLRVSKWRIAAKGKGRISSFEQEPKVGEIFDIDRELRSQIAIAHCCVYESKITPPIESLDAYTYEAEKDQKSLPLLRLFPRELFYAFLLAQLKGFHSQFRDLQMTDDRAESLIRG